QQLAENVHPEDVELIEKAASAPKGPAPGAEGAKLRGGATGFKSARQRKQLESFKNDLKKQLEGKQLEAFKKAVESEKVGGQFMEREQMLEIFNQIKRDIKP